MDNAVFGKSMEKVKKKNKNIKLFTIERRSNYLVSEPNFHTRKFFTENLLAIETRKAEILIKKPFHLGLSILELSKILMSEFQYDYVKSKYGEKATFFQMDTDSFIVYIKADGIYKDIAEDAETRPDTSNYELDRPLPKGENKKVIG